MKEHLSKNLQENIDLLEQIFDRCKDIVKKKFELERNTEKLDMYVIYVDGLTDSDMIESVVLRPLLYEWKSAQRKDSWEKIFYQELETADVEEEEDLDELLRKMMRGDTALFVDGYAKAFIVSSKKLPVRSVDAAENETGMRGPRDSFTESIRTTTALIRRRIRDPKLKVEQAPIGIRSKTEYALLYMDDLVRKDLVSQIKKEIEEYVIDGVFDISMVQHLMEKNWYSPFPLVQTTQRPDKAASGLLEGRVVLALDNSPEVLIFPATANMFFQAPDDYYNRWGVGTFARILRYIAAVLAVFLPGFYVAVTMYHPEILPTDLLLVIVRAREQVPVPVIIEVLMMELEFELLREAGIRIPGQMGNTIGIVGGLIVGQAAVDAGLVSTIVVIVVALAAIAAFAIPNEAFVSSFRLLKFIVLIVCGFFGLYGFFLCMLWTTLHLASMESYNIPYLSPAVGMADGRKESFKDFLCRLPQKTLIFRPPFTVEENKRRMRSKEEWTEVYPKKSEKVKTSRKESGKKGSENRDGQ